MNSAPAPVTLSKRLVQFFMDSATREVGADKLPTILAENHLSPSIIEKAHLEHLDGADAAVLYASLQQALRLFYGRGARGILLRIGEGMWDRMMAQANFLENCPLAPGPGSPAAHIGPGGRYFAGGWRRSLGSHP